MIYKEKDCDIYNVVKKRIDSNDFLVLFEIDWGYRLCFYFPELSENSFIEWWKNFDKIDETSYQTLDGLPGVFYDAEETSESYDLWFDLLKEKKYIYIQFNADYGSWLDFPNGEQIKSKGYSIEEGVYSNIYKNK